MNSKITKLSIFFIIILSFTLLTCDILNRPMTLILPAALYAGDTSLNTGDGVIEIYDYEEAELIIELEIIPADEDNENNNNVDTDDLSKILTVPAFVKIPEDELSVTFTCEANETDMGGESVKDITVRATAVHYQDAEDTIAVYDATATPEP